uniref:Uncharacterized protein n=1 Tax=Quercus lobata TaxID=97700 RepID=A0A7N2N6R6_QUELO
MKELGSCFRPVKVTERDNIKPADYATRKPLGPSHAATVSSSSTSISARQPKGSLFRDMNVAKKIKEKALLVDEEKPLRERVPESIPKPKPTPTPTLTAVPAPTLALPSSKDQVIINDKDSNEKLNEMTEFVWANKYRPKALEDFICNRDKAMGLRTLMREGVYGHVIFEGQPGVGKRTMIWAMLRDAFGPDRIQARDECKAFKLKVILK